MVQGGNDMLGIGERLIHVPKGCSPANAHIVRAFAVCYWAPLDGFAGVKHDFEGLELETYEITRIFCYRSRVCDYQYNRFTHVTYDVLSQERHGHRFASLSRILCLDAGAVLFDVRSRPDKVNARHL
ncbi:conserved hypothetical protein [Arthrobacter sp. 8AJ]|nr:conserved hypothetical protein [Arthrobacter sp. 8AJ]